MIWPRDIFVLIFDLYRKTESLCTLRHLNQYYNQLYRNELICDKLNRIINIYGSYGPGRNFSARMKEEFKKRRNNKSLYLCVIEHNIENLRMHNNVCFLPVKHIEPIDKTTLLWKQSIYIMVSNKIFIEWQHDGRFILKSYEIKDNRVKVRTIIPRIREISYGIRCIAVILIEGKYTIAHCLVDPVTATILEIYELETGSYLDFWYACTLL